MVDDDLRRSRVVSPLRLPLAVPHLVWLALWTMVALVALVVGWIAAVVRGRLPIGLHRLLAAYARATIHVAAFASGAANPFPGFVAALPYPLDLVLAGPARQRRASVAARPVLALPVVTLSAVLLLVVAVCAVTGWAVSVALGRMPVRLQRVLVACLRFQALTLAYVLLLTGRYPRPTQVERT